MFSNGFVERHDLEQYFWTTTTVHKLRRALDPEHLCCLATPSLAHAFHVEDLAQEVRLLDIDTRFSVLASNSTFRVVVFDPPFFYIPMDALHRAVLAVCKGDTTTKLLIGFLVREQASLLAVFKEFGLTRTKFVLEYATVKSNKWRNYALYSNVDLPGIKRIRSKA
jgi:hypothetical protein